MQVRTYEPGDLDRILDIEQASFASEAWDARLFRAYAVRTPELFLVALSRRKIAGYSLTRANSRTAELLSIAVLPEYRSHGAGSRLMRETLARLRTRRVPSWWLMVSLDNSTAIRFYEAHGFERQRRVRDYCGRGRDAWRMQRALEQTAGRGHESRP